MWCFTWNYKKIELLAEFLEIKYNNNYRLINLIHKTHLYYFLSLFKSVIAKININLKKDKKIFANQTKKIFSIYLFILIK